MKRFFVCRSMETGDIILLAVEAVKIISRFDGVDRADMLTDYDGNYYECYDEMNACPRWRDCIVGG